MSSRKWIAKKYNDWKQKNKSKKEVSKEVLLETDEHDLEIIDA